MSVEYESLFKATQARIQKRLAEDEGLKMIRQRLQEHGKRAQQDQMDFQRRAEQIVQEEWTETMKQVKSKGP